MDFLNFFCLLLLQVDELIQPFFGYPDDDAVAVGEFDNGYFGSLGVSY
jgi:hypothetical protein